MAGQHWRAGLRELRGSLSKRAFIAAARRLVPEVTAADVVPAPAGVRAQAVDADGSLVDDFRIGSAPGSGPRGDRPQRPVARSHLVARHRRVPGRRGR